MIDSNTLSNTSSAITPNPDTHEEMSSVPGTPVIDEWRVSQVDWRARLVCSAGGDT